jgi:hypothetical protein
MDFEFDETVWRGEMHNIFLVVLAIIWFVTLGRLIFCICHDRWMRRIFRGRKVSVSLEITKIVGAREVFSLLASWGLDIVLEDNYTSSD